MKAKLFIFALASLLLTGCLDEKAMFQKMVPKDEDALARHFIELIRTGDYDAAQQMLTPSLRGDQASQWLQKLHGLFDHGNPLEIETIGCNVSNDLLPSQQTRRTDLSYQIHFKDSWVAGDVVLGQKSDAVYVLGTHFRPITDSLENINRFTLSGKSPIHFAVLALCVLIPSFMLYALVVCIRSPIRRKWLWIIFIIFGLMKFRFDWTSGRSDVQPVSIVLFGTGAFSSGFCGPWVLDWSLPVGALVFLVRRRKLTLPNPPIRQPAA